MTKSAKRRHDTQRLRAKWLRLLKTLHPERNLECITFGKVFNTDPFDCGNPKCGVCSYGKVYKTKRPRLLEKRRTRSELAQDLLFDVQFDNEEFTT